jgi:glycosyltransferase involved in cell wall biosynthesis
MSGDFFTAGLSRVGLQPGSRVFRWFLALRAIFLRRADAFVAITPDMVDEFLAIGVRRDAVEQIPNAVDTCRFSPVGPGAREDVRQRLGLPRTAFIASYTGRLVSYKGLPRLLRVWRDIVRARPDAVLVLVGTGGLDIHNREESLRHYVAQNALEDNVRFAGSVDNVHEYLQASDAFVFPTENDAFPSSVVEAMACGLPVLATPVGAIGSIIQDGLNGLLVAPGDDAALERGLHVLLDDLSLGTRLGQAARETADALYSAERVGETYVRLFEQVVAARAAR